MKLDVLNMQGEKTKSMELPASIFQAPIRQDLMHQALVRQLANARLGTHKTKTRSEVSGGGRKPWRQKGTGRARHGSIRSPQWVGGGRVHAPQPRSYRKAMPKKMRRAALRSALSQKAAQKEIVLVDQLSVVQPKTKEMAEAILKLSGGASTLIVLDQSNENIERSVRNLPKVKTLRANYLNIRDILGFEQMILPVDALEIIESYLGTTGETA